ncbi:hypothetical protein D0864_11495 [Hortaea werneckii]|uniref:Gfd2/YDR514C-like C-terminal domain-containing protein n=1 Tax=Hortaea werneckii TaxID=91943 RepID=A0A3M7DV83_HORWE|nr:hypothetical protein KC323_g4115 [Hortaea werneckii]KAI7199398.1 hypothetical protein KC352_g19986 [Hortaea werneckii]KAI7558558.1 hypothetical protein KC317_g10935 [Hortaea werneckii]KAI7651206.1 hypothetical protein KC319_g10912 [Hortaea werneckii]KAI7695478.1 hypothetical protein KC322_g10075 [Hortaea werneckii]
MPPLPPLERFLNLAGGEQTLPPISKPRTKEKPISGSEELEKLPSVEEVVAECERENAAYRLQNLALFPSGTQPQANSPRQPTQAGMTVPAPSMQELTSSDLLLDPRAGEPAPQGISFTPFLAVTKFCYKYVPHAYQQTLATAFFDANKIWCREWDLYYVWSTHYPTAKAITFVPESQLQTLLDEINKAFPRANIKLTDSLREEGLSISFDALPQDLRPRWLGHSRSRDQHDSWVAALKPPDSTSTAEMAQRDLAKFKEYMEKALEASKAKSKAKKKAQSQASYYRKQEAGKQVLRAQRYLGLATKSEGDLIEGMSDLSPAAIDPINPPCHPCEQDTVIIAIDCEAYERQPKVITEVGVATLDTRDLRGQAPGQAGLEWHKSIRARHFRIRENKHLVNHEFCEGNPDKFDFGTTELVGKDQISSVLTSCFHPPYSKLADDKSTSTTTGKATDNEERRSIILLGHDISQDINYLHSLGFSVLNRGNLLEVLDSATMYQAYRHETNPASLGSICYHFNMSAWHPHNAGNDAVHTIWAFLAIAVQDAAQRGDKAIEQKFAQEAAQRKEKLIQDAEEKADEDAQGWTVQGDVDGGEAVKPSEKYEQKKGKDGKPVFGPARPPPPPPPPPLNPADSASGGLFTMGGAPLDV